MVFMNMGVPRVCCLLIQEIDDASLTRLGQVTMAVNMRNGHVMRRVIEMDLIWIQDIVKYDIPTVCTRNILGSHSLVVNHTNSHEKETAVNVNWQIPL